jgi:hypothetical protein
MTPTADDRGGSLAGTRREAGFLFKAAQVTSLGNMMKRAPIGLKATRISQANDKREKDITNGC